MNLLELIPVLEKEGKIRRSSWNEKCYLTKRGEWMVYFKGTGEVIASVSWTDLKANDWEVVEDKKPAELFLDYMNTALGFLAIGNKIARKDWGEEDYLFNGDDGYIYKRQHEKSKNAITTSKYRLTTDDLNYTGGWRIVEEEKKKPEIKTETFNFNKALIHMNNGRKVSRDVWGDRGSLGIDENGEYIISGKVNGKYDEFNESDYVATDWHLVEEYKENKSGSGCPNYPD